MQSFNFFKALMLLLSIGSAALSCIPAPAEYLPDAEVPLSVLLKTETDIPFELNPFGIAPLTARCSFKTKTLCKASIEIMGDPPLTHELENYRENFELNILGLLPGQTNQVVVTLVTLDGVFAKDTLLITTDPVPADFPEITIDVLQPAAMEPGLHFAELSLGTGERYRSTPICFDNRGTIRWWLELDQLEGLCWPIQQLANGNLLFARNHYWYEYSMLGAKMNEWQLSGYYIHHDIIELPDGNFLAISDKEGAEVIAGTGQTVPSKADHILLLDRNSGALLREWDVAQLLDVDRYEILGTQEDWLHMNGIWYDDTDQSIVFSGRNQGVVKVNWDNELQWILAPHQGWGLSGRSGDGPPTSPFLLTAIDPNGDPYPVDIQEGTAAHPDFSWSWGQHAPEVLPNGNVIVFDNGFKRNFGAGEEYSRGVEFEIDEAAGTVRQVWAYGEERGSAFYASIISDVDALALTGNRLIAPGVVRTGNAAYSKIVEVDPQTNTVVFEATLDFKNMGGNGTPTWWNMDISYRAGRGPLFLQK